MIFSYHSLPKSLSLYDVFIVVLEFLRLHSEMSTIMRRTLFSFVQKRFLTGGAPPASSSPASSPLSPDSSTSSSSFTVQFLIKSCGFSSNSALSTSQKLQLDEKSIQKAQSVLRFFKSLNFDDTHISKLIQKRPRVLHCSIQGNLKPKFDFLIENGFLGELLPQLIVSNSFILRRSLDSQIKPSFQFLRSYLHTNEKVVQAIKRESRLVTSDLMGVIRPNVDLLINEGVAVERIEKLIISQPRSLMQKFDRMVYAINSLKNLGVESKAPMFIHALRVMLCMSESTWRKKIEAMKSLGWSEEEILDIFKRHPSTLGYSEKKITSAMDFLLNIMGLERQIIYANPCLLGCSIEKRIRPRYNVIKVLESKELLSKRDKNMAALMVKGEKKFLEDYVTKYADKVPGLLEIYGSTGKA